MPKPTDKNLMRGTFTTVIDLDTLRASIKTADELPKEIPILPKGEFMTLPYGNMVLDDNVFEQMIGNFNGNVRKAVPLDVDHAFENTRAGGWLTKLSNKDDGLWAELDYTPFGAELVKNREYRMISAEWSFDYVDPQKSTHHGAVLVAATLTNRPLMQSMPTITASEKNLTNPKGIMILLTEDTKTANNMPNLTDILKKPAAERTPEELQFILDNEKDLTEEQTAQLDKETADAKEAEEAKAQADLEEAKKKEQEEAEAKAKKEKEEAGESDEDTETPEQKEANAKDVTIKAGELARLQKLEADMKASEVMKAAENFSKPFLASEKGGKVLPAGKESLHKLVASLNDEQRTLLASVLKATADQEVTEQKGDDDKDGLTATERYNNLITKLMSEKKLTPSQAVKEVKANHKEIWAAYEQESK